MAEIIPNLENLLDTLSGTGLAVVVDPVTVPFAHRIDRGKGRNIDPRVDDIVNLARYCEHSLQRI